MSRLLSAGFVAAFVLFLSPPAGAQAIDAAFRSDIEKLLEVTGAGALGLQMATLASNQIIDSMKQAQPQMPDRVVVVIKEVLNAEFAKAFDATGEMHGRFVAIYARRFTHEDVQALLTFYATPVGRKMIATMPMLAQEGAAAGQEWAVANMPRVGAILGDRLRAEGLIK